MHLNNMVKIKIKDNRIDVEDTTNLNAVTTATNGSSVDMRFYKDKSIFVNVSINSGAVTVNIEASHDGSTWFNVNSTIYTATTAKDIRSYTSYFPYMRTTTTTQSTSTVTTTITGRG